MSRWSVAVALGQALLPVDLAAQLGEVHLGAIIGYGTSSAYEGGAGLIVGVAAGRLVYAGARWVYYFGSSGTQTDTGGTFLVRDRAQIFAVDVGLQYPAGPAELVGGVTIGAVRFAQRAEPMPQGAGGAIPQSTARAEFLLAPNFSVQLRVLRFVVVPEVMYSLSGSPDVRWPVDHQGPVFSVRVVMPFEVQRIRR